MGLLLSPQVCDRIAKCELQATRIQTCWLQRSLPSACKEKAQPPLNDTSPAQRPLPRRWQDPVTFRPKKSAESSHANGQAPPMRQPCKLFNIQQLKSQTKLGSPRPWKCTLSNALTTPSSTVSISRNCLFSPDWSPALCRLRAVTL